MMTQLNKKKKKNTRPAEQRGKVEIDQSCMHLFQQVKILVAIAYISIKLMVKTPNAIFCHSKLYYSAKTLYQENLPMPSLGFQRSNMLFIHHKQSLGPSC